MSLRSARSKNGVTVQLSSHRLNQILRKHNELRGCEYMILETIETPDYILKGYKGELLAVKHYDETPLGSKDLVAVYR